MYVLIPLCPPVYSTGGAYVFPLTRPDEASTTKHSPRKQERPPRVRRGPGCATLSTDKTTWATRVDSCVLVKGIDAKTFGLHTPLLAGLYSHFKAAACYRLLSYTVRWSLVDLSRTPLVSVHMNIPRAETDTPPLTVLPTHIAETAAYFLPT